MHDTTDNTQAVTIDKPEEVILTSPVERFRNGLKYRIAVPITPKGQNKVWGTLQVIREVKPLDHFRTRTLLCELSYPNMQSSSPITVFVEEGYSTYLIMDGNGRLDTKRVIKMPSEVARVVAPGGISLVAYATNRILEMNAA